MPKQAKRTKQAAPIGEDEFKNPEYGCYWDKWRRAREVIEGEDTIKYAGTRYLPMLEGQSSSEYEAYKNRTKFVNATGRTLSGLHGMIFRKDPTVTVVKEMEPIQKDATLYGQSLLDYTKFVVGEVVSVARGGTLVDYEETEKRPYFSFYKAENIWHWQTGRRKGKIIVTLLVLREDIEQPVSKETKLASAEGELPELDGTAVERLRVCVMTDAGYEVRIFERDPEAKQKEFRYIETIIPVRNGKQLEFIPFVFHNPEDCLPGCRKLPLEDIISVNLHHYRLHADYDHGLHFTALPTAWVAGFKDGSVLKIGSSTAWVTESTDAKAGYLEFTGQGLNAIKDALEQDKNDMAVLGARLLETQKRDAEAAETVRLRQAGESSVLSNIANATSIGITMAMQIAFWWQSTLKQPSDVKNEQASIQLSTDFVETRLSPEDQKALVASWIGGAISHTTVLENFRRGEILPKNRTDEEELALIEANPPPIPAAKAPAKPAKK